MDMHRRGGTEQSGFELSVDGAARVLHVRVWGWWDLPLLHAYRDGVRACSQQLAGRGWEVVTDARDLPRFTEDFLRTHGTLMMRARLLGMRRESTLRPRGESQLRLATARLDVEQTDDAPAALIPARRAR